MRQLDKVTAGALILDILAGTVFSTVTNWPFAYGLIIMLAGGAATVFANVAYDGWIKARPKKVEVAAKAEEKAPALDVEVVTRDPPRLFCESCGTYNSPKYKYCHKCGSALKREPKMIPIPEVPASPVPTAVEPDKQMIVTQDRFSVYMGERFNEIQAFIDTRLVRMEVVLQVASEQVKNKMMSASEFVAWAKEKQSEVEAVDAETDTWIGKLGELKALITQRLDYAKSRQGHMAIKSAESIPDPEKMREFIDIQRKHFELQERIARRLMDWHDGMERVLTDTKDHIDEMFWEAILASIPAEVKVGGGEKPQIQAQEKA